jgi:hypothetical protein
MSTNTCRFCHGWEGEMVRYGVRHCAHLECALAKQGMNFIRAFRPEHRWKIANFYTDEQIFRWLPAKDRTLAIRDELRTLLGREA